MVNTRTSKRKSPPAARSNYAKASAKRSYRDISDDEEVGSEHPLILVPPREEDFNAKTWWMVDLAPIEETSLKGASALVKRCMRTYSWDETKARKILASYRQFIILKKELKDWNAEILSPCHLVDQMWHCHILDVVNYCHDMMLLCGHVVGHNPDGALDCAAKHERDETTRASLKDHFGSYDEDVWIFAADAADKTEESAAMKSEVTSNEGDMPITITIGDMPITISIKDQDGEDTWFKVLKTTRMSTIFNAYYATRKGASVGIMRFLLGGDRVCFDDTPETLELDDGDYINCFLEQCGC
eukprot:scaffold756_cov137-Skeletonema_menzelii.AAC.5